MNQEQYLPQPEEALLKEKQKKGDGFIFRSFSFFRWASCRPKRDCAGSLEEC